MNLNNKNTNLNNSNIFNDFNNSYHNPNYDKPFFKRTNDSQLGEEKHFYSYGLNNSNCNANDNTTAVTSFEIYNDYTGEVQQIEVKNNNMTGNLSGNYQNNKSSYNENYQQGLNYNNNPNYNNNQINYSSYNNYNFNVEQKEEGIIPNMNLELTITPIKPKSKTVYRNIDNDIHEKNEIKNISNDGNTTIGPLITCAICNTNISDSELISYCNCPSYIHYSCQQFINSTYDNNTSGDNKKKYCYNCNSNLQSEFLNEFKNTYATRERVRHTNINNIDLSINNTHNTLSNNLVNFNDNINNIKDNLANLTIDEYKNFYQNIDVKAFLSLNNNMNGFNNFNNKLNTNLLENNKENNFMLMNNDKRKALSRIGYSHSPYYETDPYKKNNSTDVTNRVFTNYNNTNIHTHTTGNYNELNSHGIIGISSNNDKPAEVRNLNSKFNNNADSELSKVNVNNNYNINNNINNGTCNMLNVSGNHMTTPVNPSTIKVTSSELNCYYNSPDISLYQIKQTLDFQSPQLDSNNNNNNCNLLNLNNRINPIQDSINNANINNFSNNNMMINNVKVDQVTSNPNSKDTFYSELAKTKEKEQFRRIETRLFNTYNHNTNTNPYNQYYHNPISSSNIKDDKSKFNSLVNNFEPMNLNKVIQNNEYINNKIIQNDFSVNNNYNLSNINENQSSSTNKCLIDKSFDNYGNSNISLLKNKYFSSNLQSDNQPNDNNKSVFSLNTSICDKSVYNILASSSDNNNNNNNNNNYSNNFTSNLEISNLVREYKESKEKLEKEIKNNCFQNNLTSNNTNNTNNIVFSTNLNTNSSYLNINNDNVNRNLINTLESQGLRTLKLTNEYSIYESDENDNPSICKKSNSDYISKESNFFPVEIVIEAGQSHISIPNINKIDNNLSEKTIISTNVPINIQISLPSTSPAPQYSKLHALIFNTCSLNSDQCHLVLKNFIAKLNSSDMIYCNIINYDVVDTLINSNNNNNNNNSIRVNSPWLTKEWLISLLEYIEQDTSELSNCIYVFSPIMNYLKILNLVKELSILSMDHPINNILNIVLVSDLESIIDSSNQNIPNTYNVSNNSTGNFAYYSAMKNLLTTVMKLNAGKFKSLNVSTIILDSLYNKVEESYGKINLSFSEIEAAYFFTDLSQLFAGMYFSAKDIKDILKASNVVNDLVNSYYLLNCRLKIKGNQDISLYLDSVDYEHTRNSHNEIEVHLGNIGLKENKVVNLNALVMVSSDVSNTFSLPLFETQLEFVTTSKLKRDSLNNNNSKNEHEQYYINLNMKNQTSNYNNNYNHNHNHNHNNQSNTTLSINNIIKDKTASITFSILVVKEKNNSNNNFNTSLNNNFNINSIVPMIYNKKVLLRYSIAKCFKTIDSILQDLKTVFITKDTILFSSILNLLLNVNVEFEMFIVNYFINSKEYNTIFKDSNIMVSNNCSITSSIFPNQNNLNNNYYNNNTYYKGDIKDSLLKLLELRNSNINTNNSSKLITNHDGREKQDLIAYGRMLLLAIVVLNDIEFIYSKLKAQSWEYFIEILSLKESMKQCRPFYLTDERFLDDI